jgi:hypothetical protein
MVGAGVAGDLSYIMPSVLQLLVRVSSIYEAHTDTIEP